MAKLLIVDDSEEVRTSLRKVLGEDGHDVIEADDGSSALEICKKVTDFDLIVTDQNMPNVSGLDMLRTLRGDAKFKNTYVVFHTTEPKELLRSQGQGLGINGWMVKPVDPQNVKLLVQHVLKTKKTA